LLGIVKAHRGGVRVVSKPGDGATFVVVLPRVGDAATDPDSNRPVSTPRSADRIASPASGRILVADDEVGIRTLVCAILEQDGLETVAVEDGIRVLELLEAGTGDIRLAVIDLSMPGPEGTEVFTEIRRLRPDLPVLLMSGFGKQAVLERFSAAGLFAYLQKPFEPERLLATVHEALDPV
jgi:CheY-like chemotaxis protein